MAYTGKKPTDHTDVTQSQSMTVTDDLTVDTDTLHVDSTNNRVGIGTTSPSRQLHVSGSGANTRLRVENTTGSNVFDVYAEDGGNSTLNYSSVLTMSESGTERMRIDSNGSVAIAKTVINNTTEGYHFGNGSYAAFVSDASRALLLNRLNSDGEIIALRKDNTTVGSIGTKDGDIYLGVGDTNLRFHDGSDMIYPANSNGTSRDNAIDLGHSGGRWDDIYATNGTIQTSDQNEKQQIASLTAAEITAAKAISKLFKTFKWNDKVEAKGDAARTHAGVIAQDVQQAMADAGLDAGDYAFFISATWWEAQTEVPAVEADEENGIEAADAYTRTDTYDTAEEAPEGATERTRLGIRYPELLSFVGAATEQRLADIETRIAALEAAD